MKLQNEQTGQVENFCIDKDQICSCDRAFVYDSLAQLQEAGWEDYEEPKMTGWYFINDLLHVRSYDNDDYPCRIQEDVYNAKQVGNYFETKEEAEKAVKKLKAWKRLREKGFEFDGWGMASSDMVVIYAKRKFDSIQGNKDLHLLFGSEE